MAWNEASPINPDPAVVLRQGKDRWILDNGRLRVSIHETGPGILSVGDGKHNVYVRLSDFSAAVPNRIAGLSTQ